MYINRNLLEEYPFTGQFYTVSDTMPDDGDMLDDETDMETAEETVVFETECDIEATNKVFVSDTAGSYLDIYFPFDTKKGVEVRIGHKFRSFDWYRPVDGRVTGVVPSPMGGCVVHIKEVGIDIKDD